ncbi:DUF3231 family protein [Oceanobacillus polygoni]|uniref:DUF3231 family protein n=1 Tax=Oceanobacillus polygoni TaxID=1235259 RepID=A0A9X0YN98_9BACI|nr:DUF3231 family protein [Oceanobacillus polygoni]MBP2075915.1 hypothetical protein [Oceanobacillus polygoni]
MQEDKQIRLTSGELSQLLNQYMEESASICALSYFLEKAEDEEIKPVIEHALKLSQSHLQKITSILTEEKHQVPLGFTVEGDVDLNAPRLYSDGFVLNFIHQMGGIGLLMLATSLYSSARSDITAYYKECLTETMELYEMAKDLLLKKGMYIRAPYMADHTEIEFVKKQGFIWDVFGEKRPLIASEIATLYSNIQRNALGSAALTGFSQVSQSKDVTKFMLRCIEVAKKHIELFSGKLKESNMPVVMTWDDDITTSTAYTFSDRLMMYFTTALIALSVGFYGTSTSVSPRMDLGAMYSRLSLEIQKLSEDGANIMIKNQWLEQPPMAPNRKDLAKDN